MEAEPVATAEPVVIVTETETLRATSPQSGPTGIQWDLLEADQIESIPILAMLNAARTPGSAE